MSASADPVGEAEALIREGRAEAAVALLEDLLLHNRGGILARVTLGRAQLAAGDTDAALATLREANFLAPNVALTAISLGEALLSAGALPAAVAELQRALRLDPQNGEAQWQLGRAWLEAGEPERAKEHFEAARALGARSGQEIDAALRESHEMAKAPRSAAGYVRHLFDQFSADYDGRMLTTLGYRAQQILIELWSLVERPRENLSILDLGCGTGLAGSVFRPFARQLVGVDLSPKMLEKARERGVYDELAVADVEHYLSGSGPAVDLAIAADVLVYLGDLRTVTEGVARRLSRGGLFLFTVEAKEGDGFGLGPKRRWQHSESYLRATARAGQLDIVGLMGCTPRYDAGQPIQGFAVALRKS